MSEEERVKQIIKQSRELRKWHAVELEKLKRIRRKIQRDEPAELTPSQLIGKLLNLANEYERRMKEIFKEES